MPRVASLTIAAGLVVHALPQNTTQLVERQASTKLVFAHFMMGVTSTRSNAAAYDDDMRRAKAAGIDAFALNIGTDSYTDKQLGFAYASANANGMKVFISFDFNWYNTGQGTAVGAKIAQYAGLPAQLFVNGKAFVSSFTGDGVDVAAMRAAAGRPIYFAPNFHPGQGNFAAVDGALNWMGWASNGANRAPSGGATVTVNAGDSSYVMALSGKGYIAPASPWFSTHFGPEVAWSKNWIFPSDLLWYMRWVQILALGPAFVEIITWNDYGESHYVGPLSSPHTDDGSSKWANDMPHGGWMDMAKPFIQAYKAGATSCQLLHQERPAHLLVPPHPEKASTAMRPTPSGRAQTVSTACRTASSSSRLLTAAGTVVVNSGGTAYTYSAPAGASAFAVPFRVGAQSFALKRNGAQVMTATSLKLIQNVCPCGLYNFNAYVGTVPASARDVLQSDGLSGFAKGLKVACAATPSLPATPPAVTPATTTIVAYRRAHLSAVNGVPLHVKSLYFLVVRIIMYSLTICVGALGIWIELYSQMYGLNIRFRHRDRTPEHATPH
ncbi:glycoside hydrolase family 71 protein [Mycena vulgaris]|nr:glycoside hydrolase family 71 protein [Mycena vulgaris]